MRVPRKGLLVEMWSPQPPVNIRGCEQHLSQVERTGNLEAVRLELHSLCHRVTYDKRLRESSLVPHNRPPTSLSCWRDKTQELNGSPWPTEPLQPSASLSLFSGQQDTAQPLCPLYLATNSARSKDPRNN